MSEPDNHANPYASPDAALESATEQFNYAGFWIRTGALLVDYVLIVLLSFAVGFGGVMLGASSDGELVDILILIVVYLVPPIATVLFWHYKAATPGKMLFGLRIVNATTGGEASLGQLIGRYCGYFISSIPLALGYMWVGWDPAKQGWHDKMANTLVIRN